MCAKRYEDLDAWQLADELKEKGYALIDNSAARNDFEFRNQLRDSLSSATANIAEGFGYYDHGQFARHVRIARASEMERMITWQTASSEAIGPTRRRVRYNNSRKER